MTTRFETLQQVPPSGRRRAVILDSDAYARRVIRQGAPIPWGDLAALSSFMGQVQALLDSDAGWVDVAAIQTAYLTHHPELRRAMGERTRSGYALRVMLGASAATNEVLRHLTAIGRQLRRPLVLACPSPGRWTAIAAAAAGADLSGVDADAADTASMYVADWLGRLADAPVVLVVFEATPEAGEADVASESLSAYTAVTNVAAHLGWAVAMRGGDHVETAGGASIGLIPASYWSDEDVAIAGDVLMAVLPADAVPERVLERLSLLG